LATESADLVVGLQRVGSLASARPPMGPIIVRIYMRRAYSVRSGSGIHSW